MTNTDMSLAEAMDRITSATARHIRITSKAKTNPSFAANLLIGRTEARIANASDEPDPEVQEFIDMVCDCPGPLLIRAIRESADRTIATLR